MYAVWHRRYTSVLVETALVNSVTPIYCVSHISRVNLSRFYCIILATLMKRLYFKGQYYDIPVAVWLLDTHPYHAPLFFVKPTKVGKKAWL